MSGDQDRKGGIRQKRNSTKTQEKDSEYKITTYWERRPVQEGGLSRYSNFSVPQMLPAVTSVCENVTVLRRQ